MIEQVVWKVTLLPRTTAQARSCTLKHLRFVKPSFAPIILMGAHNKDAGEGRGWLVG